MRIISVEGAWAAGKTSILKRLEKQGFKVFHSVVPTIYKARGGNSYSPRENPRDFTELFLKLKEEQYKDSIKENNDEIVFFDRIFFAPIVLRTLLNLEVPGGFYDLAKKSKITGPVFLVEPIPLENYKDGWPRKHFSYEESLRYYKITEKVITDLGFEICKIPYSSSIEEREKNILDVIDKLKTGGE